MKALAKEERERIFRLFTEQYLLRFSEIERRIGIRSNMVAYHLEQMVKEGLLAKEGDAYALTKKAEKLLPLATGLADAHPLPVILVAATHRGRILFTRRIKRPYKDYLGLPGGKMMFGETVEDACRRKLAEHGLSPGKITLCAIMNERVEEDGEIKHQFLLFLARCEVERKCEGEWHTRRELARLSIIPSDRWLIGHKLAASIPMENAMMQERKGKLSGFRVM